MKLQLLLSIVISLFLAASCNQKSEFYVSPSGDDLHPGTRGKPFATIKNATEAVRSVLLSKQHADITVYLDGGVYQGEEPIIFKPEDSGRDGFQVIYKAMPGQKPVISGGVQINNWEQRERGLWVTKLPPAKGKPWIFRELFIDGKRARRARHPNKGYLHVAKVGKDNRTNFFFSQGDFPLPENSREVELVLLHDWSITRINLKEIDRDKNKITAVDSIGAKLLDFFTIGNWEPHPRYFLENSLAFLDQPFEWYLDKEALLLYLILPEGLNPKELEIIAPYAKNLLSLKGSEENRIRNIRFDGITFSHCSYSLPVKGYAGVQACHFDPREGGTTWNTIPSAIEASWTENCSFNNCTFIHMGGSGLRFGEGSHNCNVSNSLLSDISGNGIMIGEGSGRLIDRSPWWKTVPQQVASGNRVENCVISETGQQFFGAVGIWSGITAQTHIKNNQISDLPYTGISIGWHWSTEPTPCREVRIEWNHIHHIMKTLSDGGGIYVLGFQPGGKIIGNHIHHVDVNAGRAESNGMFLDEGTTDFTVANNLIYDIAKSPLRFHRATTNLVKDNILVCGENIPPVRYNRTEEKDIVMKGNLILSATNAEDMSTLAGIIETWDYK
ncbi:MAG: right-handed parallel beta-helix repeat-containing protein [Bacteroidales bacterium]